MKLSTCDETLNCLPISKLSEKINEIKQTGKHIFNFTLGDFNPKYFPIPSKLENDIISAYIKRYTNYSNIEGVIELRNAISKHIKIHGNFDYKADEIIVASGTRPLIFMLFKTIIAQGEKVIYSVPSWNNQNYILLAKANSIVIQTKQENDFLLTFQDINPYIKDLSLIVINSPSNPSGTKFKKNNLRRIFNLIIKENKRRIQENKKPLYICFDIIYWLLDYSLKKPIISSLLENSMIKNFIIFVDGISKCFAATGIRLGWAFGPKNIINQMISLSANIGAWAAKPEQIGVANYLSKTKDIDIFIKKMKIKIQKRSKIFCLIIKKLHKLGYKVDFIKPKGTIYLAIKLDVLGMKTTREVLLLSVDSILDYLLKEANIGIVPFYFFGFSKNQPWFRISLTSCSLKDTKLAAISLEKAIKKLRN